MSHGNNLPEIANGVDLWRIGMTSLPPMKHHKKIFRGCIIDGMKVDKVYNQLSDDSAQFSVIDQNGDRWFVEYDYGIPSQIAKKTTDGCFEHVFINFGDSDIANWQY